MAKPLGQKLQCAQRLISLQDAIYIILALLSLVLLTTAAIITPRIEINGPNALRPKDSSENLHTGSNASQQIYPRAKQKLCSPPVYDAHSYKRDVQERSYNIASLWRRMKLPTAGQMESFVMEETGLVNEDEDTAGGITTYPIVWDRPVPSDDDNSKEESPGDINTATLEEFKY
ncbi:hypothetical protein K458DRAFT_397316 [Lentithecium fluviatile CBS 122367]|uniref:Uncharacterized protein n=1 Tax=Lentithecium fluviatile CBS 122367 TaxID=1168545 RepID=A0A6G1IDU0_9PLEO|nr:hypothetical protein K458DRAFT_397316 [Lentithecium fluviatile CBS 122367]